MADLSTPATGLQEAPPSVESRLNNMFAREKAQSQHKTLPENRAQAEPAPEPDEPAAAPPANAEQSAESQAGTDDPTPDDLIEVEQAASGEQPSVDEFEIVHNGRQHKLSRSDTIELAQKGFDYVAKTQAVAAQQRQVQEALDTAQQVIQLQAALSDDLAQVKAYERAMKPYENVDWVALATQDPMEYPKHRAAYDQLMQGFQMARNALQAKSENIMQGQQKATAAVLQQEMTKLRDLIPGWKDDNRFGAESKAVADYGLKEGYTPAEMNSIRDARMVATLYKAMKYDRLVASKQEKSKLLRTASPMGKPGAAESPSTKAQEQTRRLRTDLKKSGSVDAAAALFARMERNKK